MSVQTSAKTHRSQRDDLRPLEPIIWAIAASTSFRLTAQTSHCVCVTMCVGFEASEHVGKDAIDRDGLAGERFHALVDLAARAVNVDLGLGASGKRQNLGRIIALVRAADEVATEIPARRRFPWRWRSRRRSAVQPRRSPVSGALVRQGPHHGGDDGQQADDKRTRKAHFNSSSDDPLISDVAVSLQPCWAGSKPAGPFGDAVKHIRVPRRAALGARLTVSDEVIVERLLPN